VTSLIEHGRIRTTDAKAKEVRRWAERMITLGKQQSVAARRRARAFVQTDAAVAKLFAEVAPLFMNRAGGYTRIIKIGQRPGDAAPISILEFVEQVPKKEKAPKPDKKAAAAS
jgi:large subunit ribosomal protein L17